MRVRLLNDDCDPNDPTAIQLCFKSAEEMENWAAKIAETGTAIEINGEVQVIEQADKEADAIKVGRPTPRDGMAEK